MPEDDDRKERKRQRDRAYAATHRQEAKVRAKAWYYANKERAAKTRRVNYDPDEARKYNRKYRIENAAKLREFDRKRSKTEARKLSHKKTRLKNSAKIVARVARWSKQNPDKVRLHAKNVAGRRRARLKSCTFEKIDPMKVYLLNNGICGLCGNHVPKDTFELDHIIPIAKGGGHIYTNVHIAHRTCNKKKGASLDAKIYSL